MLIFNKVLILLLVMASSSSIWAEEKRQDPQIIERHNKTKNIGESKNFKYTHTFYREKKIIDKNGKEQVKREYVTQVLPGETLLAVATYTYKNNEEAKNPVFTLPLPKEAIYVEGSATDEKYVWFSVNDGKTWARFRKLRVVESNGTKRIATGNDVTHLQWRMAKSLNKGDSGIFEYKIVIR